MAKYYKIPDHGKPLPNHKYAQAYTVTGTDGTTYLVSYTTIVAKLTADGWLQIYGLYSMTTRKHISIFVNFYCDRMSYQMAKYICCERAKYNIKTGEIIPGATIY